MAKRKPTSTRRNKVTAPRMNAPAGTVSRSDQTPVALNAGLGALVVALLALVLYLPTLRYGYVLDDKIVFTQNRFVQQGIAGIGSILTTESFAGFFTEQKDILIGGRYRPLSLVTFAMERAFWGQKSALSHLINVLLYAWLGVVLLRLLRHLFPPATGQVGWFAFPLVAALLYVAHPVHSEVVANVKGRDELLAMLLGLLSWLALARGMLSPHWSRLLLAGLYFFLALLAKENALTLLAVIPLALYFFGGASPRQLLFSTLPLALATGAYLAMRYAAVGYLLGGGTEPPSLLNDPYFGLAPASKYATILLTLGWYLWLLVFPHPLTHDYYPYQVPIVSWGDWRVVIAGLIYLGLGWVVLRYWQRQRLYTFAIALFVATLSIVSNIPFNVGAALNERFLFLPSLGFSLASAGLLLHCWPQQRWGFALFLGLLVAYAGKTYHRLPDWENEYTLNTAAIRHSPNSARANLFMGVALFNRDYARAADNSAKLTQLDIIIPYVEKALQIVPDYGSAWDFRAGLAGERYVIDRQLEPLLTIMARTLRYRPDSDNLHRYLEWVATNNSDPATFANFCFRQGYSYLWKEQRNAEQSQRLLGYGLRAQPNQAQLNTALREVQQQ